MYNIYKYKYIYPAFVISTNKRKKTVERKYKKKEKENEEKKGEKWKIRRS